LTIFVTNITVAAVSNDYHQTVPLLPIADGSLQVETDPLQAVKRSDWHGLVLHLFSSINPGWVHSQHNKSFGRGSLINFPRLQVRAKTFLDEAGKKPDVLTRAVACFIASILNLLHFNSQSL
jgi:hypothetical protein